MDAISARYGRGNVGKRRFAGVEDMSFQDERLLNMMQQMPQYQQGSYDEVVAQVDFELSTHPDPKKQRRQNIKRALKALKPTKRSFFSPRRYWFRRQVCLH